MFPFFLLILANSSNIGQLIISQQIIKEPNISNTVSSSTAGTYVINNKSIIPQSTQQIASSSSSASKPNKVVFINRNTMKPCPNIISRSNVAQQLPKYTKVVVTNPKTAATTLVQRANTQSTGTPIVSSVKQVNIQTLKSPVPSAVSQVAGAASSASTSGILNVGTKQIQILSTTAPTTTTAAVVTSGAAVATDKAQIRNIVVKPGGLKQIPPHLKTQLLNRNLTVRKLVNLVPATKATTSNSQDNSVAVISTAGGTSAMQTSPKIITLNPINPSAGTSTVAAATQPKIIAATSTD